MATTNTIKVSETVYAELLDARTRLLKRGSAAFPASLSPDGQRSPTFNTVIAMALRALAKMEKKP